MVKVASAGRFGKAVMQKFKLSQQNARSIFRGCAAVVLLAMTLLLTAGPAIHGLIHKDATAPGHNCAFVHWARGEAGFAQSFAGLPSAEVKCTEQLLPVFHLFVPSVPTFIHHSRGPPQV